VVLLAIVFGCDTLLYSYTTSWILEYLGNQQYRIAPINEQGLVYTIYLDGDNLIQEHPDEIFKYEFIEYPY
jgi:hypothetical protein